MALTPLLQGLRDLLRPEVIRPGPVELREDAPGSRIAPFKLETSQPTLVLRFEDIPRATLALNDRLFPLLNPTAPGLCLHCDYVILRQARTTNHAPAPLYVLLVELKSGPLHDAQKQIENTRILVESTLKAVWHAQRRAPWTQDTRFRGLIFSPSVRPVAGDPRRHPCPYEPTSPAMPDLLLVRHPPCPGYQLDWFCP